MVEVRPIAEPDRAAWEPLWHGYQEFYGVALSDEVTDTLWSRLVDPADGPHGLVALADDQVVGIVHFHQQRSSWLVEDRIYLQDLFVSPPARGTGAGRALIEAVYDAADRAGLSEVYWLTEESNATARVLYDRVATMRPFVKYVHRRDDAPA